MPLFEDRVRFGIHSGQQNTTLADYVHLWKEVESLGYDCASVFDHFMPIFDDPEGPCFEGTTFLSALAAQTSRIRCGILVAGNTYRHPAILAKAAVTIDHLSEGRLEFGIGAGWSETDHRTYGIPIPPVGRRIRMLGETAKILKSMWTKRHTTFNGRYYTVTEALCEPKPVQRPHIPLWVGGMGEKLTLRVVAESADGWNTFFMSQESYVRKLDALSAHCETIGRDPGEIRKSLLLEVAVGETDKEVHERVQRLAVARNVDPSTMGRRGVVGTPEQCIEQLLPYLKLGVRDFIVQARPPTDLEALELVAREVAPVVKVEGQGLLAARR